MQLESVQIQQEWSSRMRRLKQTNGYKLLLSAQRLICLRRYVMCREFLGGLKHFFTCLLCDQPQASPEKQPPVKTVGPLTDEDVIKLRPCEKKQVRVCQPAFSPKSHFLF